MKAPLRKVTDVQADRTIKLTLEQYKTLQRFWWAVGEFDELLKATPDAPDGVLGIIIDSVGPVFGDLDQQVRQLVEKPDGGLSGPP